MIAASRLSALLSVVPSALLFALLPSEALEAQTWRAGASTRATTTVTLSPRNDTAGGQSAEPVRITIDYGQPHARGRAVAGALEADLDTIWRLARYLSLSTDHPGTLLPPYRASSSEATPGTRRHDR